MAKGGRGLEKKESSLMFREISPPHRWDQDLHSHYLRLTVPGFANKDISLHMDKYGHLVVRGSHQASEHKYVSFAETFDVPEGGDLEQAEGMFEDGQIYCINIPKNTKLGQTNGDHPDSDSKGVDDDHHYLKEDTKGDDSMLHKHGVGVGVGVGSHIPLPNVGLPLPLSRDNSIHKLVFLIVAILLAMYVAWLNRDLN